MANKRLLIAALATFVALAISAPVWGQSNAPTVVSTVTGVMVGMQPDGSMCNATMHIVNTTAQDVVTQDVFLTPAGTPFGFMMDGQGPFSWMEEPNPSDFASTDTLSRVNPSSPITAASVQLTAPAGVANLIVIECRNAEGVLVSNPVALADPTLVAPAVSVSFGLPAFLGPTKDVEWLLTNSTTSPVVVTIDGYDNNPVITGRVPTVTTTVTVPAAARRTPTSALAETDVRMLGRSPLPQGRSTLTPGVLGVVLSDFPEFVALAGSGAPGTVTLNYIRLSGPVAFGATATIVYQEPGDQQRLVPAPMFPAGGAVVTSNDATATSRY